MSARTDLISFGAGSINERYADPAWVIPLATFVAPMYAALDPLDSKGFDISDAKAIVISIENGATATITHEQTLDPSGLAGWFPVVGKQLDSAAGSLSAGSSTGKGYIFTAAGLRQRARVTALTVADIRFRIAKSDELIDLSTTTASQTVSGTASEDGTLSSTNGPVIQGFEARNVIKANMSANGDSVRGQATMDGKQIGKPYSIPELDWQALATITNIATDVTLKTAAGATVRNYLTALQISHTTLGAPVFIRVKDGAATTIWQGYLNTPFTEGFSIVFPTPLRGSVNSPLVIQTATATTGDIAISAQGYSANS